MLCSLSVKVLISLCFTLSEPRSPHGWRWVWQWALPGCRVWCGGCGTAEDRGATVRGGGWDAEKGGVSGERSGQERRGDKGGEGWKEPGRCGCECILMAGGGTRDRLKWEVGWGKGLQTVFTPLWCTSRHSVIIFPFTVSVAVVWLSGVWLLAYWRTEAVNDHALWSRDFLHVIGQSGHALLKPCVLHDEERSAQVWVIQSYKRTRRLPGACKKRKCVFRLFAVFFLFVFLSRFWLILTTNHSPASHLSTSGDIPQSGQESLLSLI